jgi:rubrerythrin
MSTDDNLQEAFAGESQANRKYTAFAKKAEQEGLPGIARLFRAAGAAETVHAHSHLRVLGGIETTKENLQTAIDGEGEEFREMYPEFVEEAADEGNRQAEVSFRYAMAVEEIHHELYTKAAEALKNGDDLPERSYYVCPVCGNTVEDEAPDKCPICNTPGDRFVEIG